VVGCAIMIHSRSLLITGIGILQIVLSFPLSFFVYKIVAGLDFFPFLNFIGIFVVFALGAGDIFVAIDKWRYARVHNPTASAEYIAAVAFPDAALAMWWTTITTAAAFFSTAICPVAPIKMFAIFCGLLVTFDYVMCVLLIFPALCIYDKSIRARAQGQKVNPCWMFCVTCTCGGLCSPKVRLDELEDNVEGRGVTASAFVPTGRDGATKDKINEDKDHDDEDDDVSYSKASRIQKLMLGFYYYLHIVRWPLFVISMVAFGLCAWKASQMALPTSSEVRLLGGSNQYEQNWVWRQQLLSSQLQQLSGSEGVIIWGVTPADTGDQSKCLPSTLHCCLYIIRLGCHHQDDTNREIGFGLSDSIPIVQTTQQAGVNWLSIRLSNHHLQSHKSTCSVSVTNYSPKTLHPPSTSNMFARWYDSMSGSPNRQPRIVPIQDTLSFVEGQLAFQCHRKILTHACPIGQRWWLKHLSFRGMASSRLCTFPSTVEFDTIPFMIF
jgi:hypothetical protein